jgi:hypothetical protein
LYVISTRWSIKQTSSGRRDLEPLKNLRIKKWEDHHFLQSSDVLVKASNTGKIYLQKEFQTNIL